MTKDLTIEQFRRALDRNGFECDGPLHYVDTTGAFPYLSIGVITHSDGRIARRSTVAYLIRRRKAFQKEVT